VRSIGSGGLNDVLHLWIGKAGVLQAKKHMLELLQAELEQQELEKPKDQY
jgi:hypothetical protein